MSSKNAAIAIRARLLDNANIVALCESRVYVAELPQKQAVHMPRTAVVVRLTGGVVQSHFLPYLPQRIDVIAYGATFDEAGDLDHEIAMDLHLLDGAVYHGVSLRGVDAGGGYTSRDPAFDWPYHWRTFDVHAINMDE